MIEEIKEDAETRMQKSLVALETAFAKIRTGRAHPSFLDSVNVDYYGNHTPLRQMANVNVEEGRSLVIVPWERAMIPVIEKAILNTVHAYTATQALIDGPSKKTFATDAPPHKISFLLPLDPLKPPRSRTPTWRGSLTVLPCGYRYRLVRLLI